jgi:hypothetical protein
MTETNPPPPPSEPPAAPAGAPTTAPPAAPPPAPAPWAGPPGAPEQPWQAPPNAWGQPVSPYAPPRRTNGLAITALVLGLVPVVFWPLALFLGIAAVITGHIARKQIRRAKAEGRDEQGAGMALAGLILGYVWIVLSILGTIALVLVLTLAVPAITQVSVRNEARDFGNDAVSQAIATNTTPRDPQVVQEVYRERYVNLSGSSNKHAELPDGTGLFFVTAGALEQNGYRIEFSENTIGTKYACLTLPQRGDPVVVHDGRC